MSDLTTFAKRLKEARLKAGLTQAQLAKKPIQQPPQYQAMKV